MSDLSEFLEGTVGRCLYDFWLDCESYKDTVDDVNSVNSRQLRSRLFRSVSCTLSSAERFIGTRTAFVLIKHFILRGLSSVVKGKNYIDR